MKVIDATRERTQTPWRRWRRRLHGAVARTVISPIPTETWKESLPALATAADVAMRAYLRHEMNKHGRDPDDDEIDAFRVGRADAEQLAAAVLGPKRTAQLLMHAGVDSVRAVRLLELVGSAAADAVCWLDVVDVIALGDTKRGAA